MTPSRRRKKPARRSAEGLWALLACGTVGFCFVAGVVAQAAIGSSWRSLGALPQPLDPIADELVRTGSILVIPLRGDKCEHNLFDNRTGAIWHSGYVSCDMALSSVGTEKGKGWSQARTEAIRGGFRWK